MFTDSHAHLNAPEFRHDLPEVIARAREAGVERIIVPGTDVESSRTALEIADRFEGVYACVGIHPHDAAQATEESFRVIEELSAHPKVVAVGEIGLDFYKNYSPRDAQVAAFKAQLEIARRRNLPVVVHDRDAHEALLEIVSEFLRASRQRMVRGEIEGSRTSARVGVFHAFSGDGEMARKLAELGFYVSSPGTITFKNASIHRTVQEVPAEYWMLETDSPYLTPVPFRGKRNEPSYIPLIAKRFAELRGISVEEVSRLTNHNIQTLFGIGVGRATGRPVR